MKGIVERIDFNERNMDLSQQEHLVRYLLAINYIKEKKVLDIACGTGYGAHILAPYCKEIVGLDNSDDAINLAKKRYIHKNLSFLKTDATSTNLNPSSFDVIISFETIEHIENQRAFLSEIMNLLKPDGLLLLSCPNIAWSKKHNIKNEFHFREYTYHEVRNLLSPYFKFIDIAAQYQISGSLIINTKKKLLDKINFSFNKQLITNDIPVCFIVLCSNSNQSPVIPILSTTKNEIYDLQAYIIELKSIILKDESKIVSLLKSKLGRLLKKPKKLFDLIKR